MRTLFISMLIITCLSNISSLAQPDTRQLFEKKVKNYTHLRNAGWIAVGAGACVLRAELRCWLTIFPSIPMMSPNDLQVSPLQLQVLS